MSNLYYSDKASFALQVASFAAATAHAGIIDSEESMHESSDHPYGLFHDANPKVHMRNRKKRKLVKKSRRANRQK